MLIRSPGWLRAGPYTPASPPEEGLAFPDQDGGYLGMLPNRASYGMNAYDSGLPTEIVFVTSTTDANTGSSMPSWGSDVYAGTWEWAWKRTQTTGYQKIIIPLVSGWMQFGTVRSLNTPAGVGNMEYWGHGAPGQGLYIRGGALRLNGGSYMHLWHLPSYIGDDPGGLTGDDRDALQIGNGAYYPSNIVLLNCNAAWSTDELVDAYYPLTLATMYQCAFIDPLHSPPDLPHADDPPGFDHGFGDIWGGGEGPGGTTDNDKIASFGCLRAHSTDRGPLTTAWRYAHANCLAYNNGRPGGGKGEAVNIRDASGYHAAAGRNMFSNVVRNMFVPGPENNASVCAARILGSIPSGSRGHCEGNVAAVWTPPASQDGFFTTKPVGYMQGTLTSAWPSGWGSDYSGIMQISASPLSATTAEQLAFANFIIGSVGAKPGMRSGAGRIDAIGDQIIDAINGVGASSQFVDSVTEAGGWFSVTATSITDPTAANATHWHDSLPLGSDRDDVLLSGTFSNGKSKVGYTKLQAWCIEQHYFVGGQ